MGEKKFLAEQFERHRARLQAVAYRMLGSRAEAEDAVQEAWIRLARSDADDIDNFGGWLTTVTARICLDMLRSRTSRREEPMGPQIPEPVDDAAERDTMRGDAIGPALLVVLDTLSPAERVAFVLHDIFDLPFEKIAPIIERSPAAARQLASRARRRVQGARPSADADNARKRRIVEAFLAASKTGDLAGLLRALDPDVSFRADARAVRMGAPPDLRGAEAVADAFKGRAQAGRAALIDGEIGVAVLFGGRLRIALRIAFTGDRIGGIEAIADPDRLNDLSVTPFTP
ncbi:MAG TPA: sigma-70 family RNA polymerase sigma factor [Pseudorhodoplanes sp.]|jgi:RNA polymerase sigma-70 factor (ECF subfamily)|nr:sigma-70 family RNA polymerase sigma factor [Pseudorhodoplanes sp.]